MPIRVIQPAPEPMSKGEDVARSAGTGTVQGAAGVIGGTGDLVDLLTGLPTAGAQFLENRGWAPKGTAATTERIIKQQDLSPGGILAAAVRGAAPKVAEKTGADPEQARRTARLVGGIQSLPTTKDVEKATEVDKHYHTPQTTEGKYARTAAQFLPAAAGGGSLLRRGAQVVVPALTSETAGQMTEGTALEPYARVAGALVGGGAVALAGQPMPRTRMLADASRGASDEQIAMARALREDAARRGVTLTQAEAVQQVTGNGTGMGRMQRVIEGTRAGSERLDPVMAARPGQVRGAVGQFADDLAPAAPDPYSFGQRAQEAARETLTGVRQRINANARPFYDALPEERLGQAPPMRGPDGQPISLYHGSPETGLSRLQPQARADNFDFPPVVSLSTDEAFARGYAGKDGRVYQATAAEQPVGDFRNAADLERVKAFYEANHGPLSPDDLAAIESGSWRLWENKDLWKGQGWKGAWTREEPGRPDAQTLNLSLESGDGVRLGGQSGGPARPYQELAQNPAYQEALQAVRGNNVLNGPIAHLPDDSLAVVNEVVKQLDTLAENARPNPAASTGSAQMAAAYEAARNSADELASAYSEPWRLARAMVSSGREAFLEPLQAGPLGAISRAQAQAGGVQGSMVGSQTRALYPSAPPEGAAGPTAQALEMLPQDVSAGLTRQHLMNTLNESTQDLQSGPNQWGGAKFASTIAGNPEQRAVLEAGVGAAGGDPQNLRGLLAALEATGKRQAPGSKTAYNVEDLKRLGEAGALGETAKAVASGPSMFRRFGEGLQDWQTERNARGLADALLADPARAQEILLEARRRVPPGAALQEIERLALTVNQARLAAPEPVQ